MLSKSGTRNPVDNKEESTIQFNNIYSKFMFDRFSVKNQVEMIQNMTKKSIPGKPFYGEHKNKIQYYSENLLYFYDFNLFLQKVNKSQIKKRIKNKKLLTTSSNMTKRRNSLGDVCVDRHLLKNIVLPSEKKILKVTDVFHPQVSIFLR